MTRLTALLVLSLWALPGPDLRAQADMAKKLASPDAVERLKAVRQLAESNSPDAGPSLQAALKDKDWEVVEIACLGLARVSPEKASPLLAELTLKGPARQLRHAAAKALASIAAGSGPKLLIAGLKGQAAVAAAEALQFVKAPEAGKPLLAALRSPDRELRREAATALGGLSDTGHLPALAALFKDAEIGVRAGVTLGLVRGGLLDSLPVLLRQIEDPAITDVEERRLLSAVRRILILHRESPALETHVATVIAAFRKAVEPAARTSSERQEAADIVAARFARLLGSLGRAAPPPPPPPPEKPPGADVTPEKAKPEEPHSRVEILEGSGPIGPPAHYVAALADAWLLAGRPRTRRAAVAALGRIRTDEAVARIQKAAEEDQEPAVRAHALRALVAARGAADEPVRQLLVRRLESDDSPVAREAAAVALGVQGAERSVTTLIQALKDTPWELVSAAAVSLGMTRSEAGVAPLAALLKHKDWRIRGSGVVGLGRSMRKSAIPPLIGALGDSDPSVSRTAYEILKRHSGRSTTTSDRKSWQKWWEGAEKRFEIVDRAKDIREAKKHGYAVRDEDVYEDLDVVVLQSRGDHVEFVLDHLSIGHRFTRSGAVIEAALHPFGVFVSNCTGEIQAEDIERLQWFVRTGGVLLGTCWAVHHTIALSFPDSIRKFEGVKQEVLDTVRAEEVPTATEYLKGVFPGATRPSYELFGAYLIEVVDPERCEVLIDSPDCASKWGSGNLAAWFTAGHGVVVGSSNHIDLQGKTLARLGTDIERMAHASDHLGLSWAQIRDLRERGVFKRQPDAVREARDLSAFRFVTNFVRRKRLTDG